MRLAAVIVAGVMVLRGAGAQVAAPRATVAEQYLFSAANAERAQRGLGALRWDDALYQAATFHARQMAEHGGISHRFAGEPELTERGRAAGARFSVIAENVAQAPTAVRIEDAWMKSPGHRANLLDPRLDAVAIRVERRGGELFAVEDFERGVERLSLEEQERAVAALVQGLGDARVVAGSEDARRTCGMSSGYAGQRRPEFVMRYTTGDLQTMPEALQRKLRSAIYSEVAVGACASGEAGFTAFSLAVMVYP
jgi:hypothetical protein